MRGRDDLVGSGQDAREVMRRVACSRKSHAERGRGRFGRDVAALRVLPELKPPRLVMIETQPERDFFMRRPQLY